MNQFAVTKTQILIRPDKIKPEIRLNEEVKARITATFKDKHKQPRGDTYQNDLGDEIHNIELTDSDDPNCGHLTMLLLGIAG